jgi:hypothetical protein
MTAKTKAEGNTKGLCHYESLTRTKFFHGMLLTDEHLRAEQTYHREALKRVNRHLWGAGIVCGLEVGAPRAGLCIKVHPGLALDCDGNVIEVCKSITIDLADICKKAFPDGCAPDESAAEPITKHLVLRYREIPADPQAVLTPDDDCAPPGEGTKCEASKYREGFCLELRDECPDCEPCGEERKDGSLGLVPALLQFAQRATDTDATEWLRQYRPPCTASPPCPDCHCDDGAVGLATLVIDCAGNTVQVNCDCRQYVWSPRLLQWLICELLRNIDQTQLTGLKQALGLKREFLCNPMKTAWDVGDILLAAREVDRHQEERDEAEAPAGATRRTRTARVRAKQEP